MVTGVQTCALPISAPVDASISPEQCLGYVLAGGDDYELLFTAPKTARAAVQAAAQSCDLVVTRIGQIEAATGLRLRDAGGKPVTGRFASFDHFA